ncbi:hypothetical protein SKAU_G00143710 [Synaphobranchus kaupii]|uniref:Uncharacterized protein n=1 Tax=Synaphobranchus kaupii TaxID=118154 RepID=A0A9Q1J4M9_SYNKA|nr:hypothetical protein SKAU_G00143710 [Synaphobranchus kaupii]
MPRQAGGLWTSGPCALEHLSSRVSDTRRESTRRPLETALFVRILSFECGGRVSALQPSWAQVFGGRASDPQAVKQRRGETCKTGLRTDRPQRMWSPA